MNEATHLPTSIPKEFYPFFWDVNPETVNPSINTPYVIQRLLDKGNLEAARWVIKTFPKEMIVETFKTRKDFSPWTGVFWARYLGIPREEVACLEPSYRKMRSQLWPY